MSRRPVHLSSTDLEELANGLTHGAGLLLSVVGLCILVVFATTGGSVTHIISGTVFGVSLVFLYTASTFYHFSRIPRLKRFLQTLDHIAIYVLIAGSYTPFLLINLRGGWGWTLFGVIWGLALAGAVFKIFFTGRFNIFSTFVYLAMGWLVIIATKPMLEAVSFHGLIWIAGGGLFYTFGIGFYAWERLPYHHSIWHLFVLGGSTCHFFAVLFHSIQV